MGAEPAEGAARQSVTNDEYCREIEAYLCRKNDGHLIRLVGPSFERVCSWWSQGIPFKIACEAIDRYFVRYYAKGRRRRPVQIDFCEADVLDAFDAWRRAVGVRLPGAESSGEEAAKRPRHSLPEHLNRVLERLTALVAGPDPIHPALKQSLEDLASEVSSFSDLPGPIRGEARARISGRLAELDRLMLDSARAHADAATLQSAREEAAIQLAPFRERMPADAFQHALDAAVDSLLRERAKLPVVAFD
jgi:hypothetical protein